MTSHNLGEHLPWLIQTNPPPTLPHWCTVCTQSTESDVIAKSIPNTFRTSDRDRSSITQQDEEESSVLLGNIQGKPAVVTGVEGSKHQNDMAKLKSTTSSARKQLISQQPIPQSSPSSHRRRAAPYPATGAVSYASQASGNSKPTSSETQISTSSNIEVWDEGQTLWNEEVASRIEPVRRHKRTSTDLDGDQAFVLNDSFSAEFPDIDAIALPSTIHGLLPPFKKQKVLTSLKAHREGSKLERRVPDEDHESYAVTSVAQSSPVKPRHQTVVQNSSPSATIKQTPQLGRNKTLDSGSNRAQKSRRIVGDSEDDEDDAENHLQIQSPTFRENTRPDLKPAKSSQSNFHDVVANSPRLSPKRTERRHVVTKVNDDLVTPNSRPESSNSSFFEDAVASKVVQHVKKNMTKGFAPASTADKQDLQLVLDCPEDKVTNYVDRLLAERAELALEIQQAILDGQKIMDLAKKCDALHDELSSLHKIIDFKAEYQIAAQERASARTNIAIAAESEQSTEPYVQQSKHANQKCLDIGARILELLSSTSPDFKTYIGNSNNQSLVSSNSENKARGVIVQSTQAYAPHPKALSATSVKPSNNSLPSQFVMQTPQIWNESGSDQTDGNELLSRNQEPISARTPTIIVEPQRHKRVEFQHRSMEPTASLRSPQVVQDELDDYYGEDDDDADYLAAIEQAEAHRRTSPMATKTPNRQILQPTTGNSMRTPIMISPKKSPYKPNPADLQHPWSKDLLAKLHHTFKMRGFRENQLEAMNSTIAGNDTFVLMPTGGGKSLCYQLPALLRSGKTQGVTIVISPLLSLMQDQVDHLQKLQIQAFYISGDVSQEHKSLIMQGLRDPDPQKLIQLLYITPEMINKNVRFVDLLCDLNRRQRFARLVIDEAHCVSQWGHDFRPDYKTLGALRTQHFPNVPVLALTATATELVKTDVQHNLSMNNCKVFSQSFNRPNLTYEVSTKPGTGPGMLQAVVNIIRSKHNREAGIIYCLSRRNCEDLAGKLHQVEKIQAAHYHAGMTAEERSSTQKRWQSGQIKIIVATIAFGMGIDKPDVRFVIHQSVPWTLEGYYQETGRAGRDGKLSHCYLFFSSKDVVKLKRMLFSDKEIPQEQKDRKLEMLKKMEQFCQNHSDCRRSQVLNYFNERFTKEQCMATCDNCWNRHETEIRDYTDVAAAAVGLVIAVSSSNLDKGLSIINCIDAFVGSKSSVQNLSHLKNFGHGKHLKRGETERVFYHLLLEDAIQEKQEINRGGFPFETVTLGRRYRQFADGRIPVKLEVVLSKEPTSIPNSPKKKSKKTRLPLSTEVPSPKRKGRKVQRHKDDTLDSDGFEAETLPQRDRFIIDDEEDEDYLDSQDDYNAEATSAFVPRNKKQQKSGRPITMDEQLDGLDELHRDIVEAFVVEASKLGKKILLEQNLAKQPFTVLNYRAMAIDFPKNLEEMEQLPDIDPDRVRLFGLLYLPLIAQVCQQFQSICQPDTPFLSHHHSGNSGVITISDDEGTLDDSGLFTREELEDAENLLDDTADASFDNTAAVFSQKFNDINTFDRGKPSHNGRRTSGPRKFKAKRGGRSSSGSTRGSKAPYSGRSRTTPAPRAPKSKPGGSGSGRPSVQKTLLSGGIRAMET